MWIGDWRFRRGGRWRARQRTEFSHDSPHSWLMVVALVRPDILYAWKT